MIYSLLIKKGAIRSLQSLLISFALFFLFNETIFAGYIPLFGLVPSPASTFTCINRASTIATSTSKFILHTILH